MSVYFLRHSHKAGNGRTSPLTPHGRLTCEGAARWLAGQGAVPALVRVTANERTRETAELVLTGLQLGPDVVRWEPAEALPRTAAGLAGLLEELGSPAGPDSRDVLVLGHGQQQRLVEKSFGGHLWDVPARNRCAAFRLERGDTAWRVVAAWPGSEPADWTGQV